ncbi:MAG: peptide-methionine (S)-S-oxide reductase MsrA [Novipirellula sp. JB048]
MSSVQRSVAEEPAAEQASEAVATLAGGCFWCTEAVFERIEGVNDVVSGYIGGTDPAPTYEKVLSGKTGHAEAVEVYYDPSKRTYEEILQIFFKTHDPTSLNRQGNDVGTQYRSAVFYHSEAEKKKVQDFIEKLNQSGEYSRRVVTTLEPATKFHPAEEYHQDYYRRNPNAGYCRVVVRNKVRKTNREFSDMLKKP